MAYRRHRRHYRRHRRVARTRRMRSPEKSWLRWGAEKIWENRHHIPYWPSWLTPKKGQTKPKQSSAKSYYSRVPLKVQSRVPKRNTTMVSTPQVLVSTETSVPLCRVVGGTASNTRTTNTIAVKGSTIRFLVRREPTGTGTVPALVPTITFVVWRDKIPATVGAIPTILAPMPIPLRRQR